MKFKGTAGNDNLTGTAGNDTFDLSQGGDDVAKGLGGNDTFVFGTTFNGRDSISGGAGTDTLSLAGNYTGAKAVHFGAATMIGVENIDVAAGFSYSLTLNQKTIATDARLTIHGDALSASNTLTVDASAATDKLLTVKGGAGKDSFSFGGAFNARDSIDGGGGNDTLSLAGDYSGANALRFRSTTLTNVEDISLAEGGSYALTFNDATIAAHRTLTIDGHALSADDTLAVNATADTDGALAITGGAGADTFTFGSHFSAADSIDGGGGNDSLHLDGNYTGAHALQFGKMTLLNVENISLARGHSYTLGLNAHSLADGSLSINAHALGSDDSLTVNANALTQSSLTVVGGAGRDVVRADSASVLESLHYHGGHGHDILLISGNQGDLNTQQPMMLSSDITGVETIKLAAGSDYILGFQIGSETGKTITVDGSAVGADNHCVFENFLAVSDHFHFIGGAGVDIFVGNDNSDVLTGGGGNDDFEFGSGITLGPNLPDHITDIDFGGDKVVDVNVSDSTLIVPTGIDATVTTGTLSAASFVSDLAAAVGASNLLADHAVLFTANAGDFSGHTFLVVDGNGAAGFQNGDLVIDVTGFSGTLTTGSFFSNP